jgi:monovalent cation/hydrogen antiporter
VRDAAGVVAIAATVIAVTSLLRHTLVPPPLGLTVVGIVASAVPWIPDFQLSPELVLVGLVPALLYAAALNTSVVDFRANLRPIALLSVGLVLFSTVLVGLVTWWILPVNGPAAFALGAIVAPPDAVAATAIVRRVGIPRRTVTILEGESLVNDATALVALRTAIAAIGGTVSVWQVGLEFVWAVAGGLVAGVVVAMVVGRVRYLVTDEVTDTAISLVTPFLAYLLAESVHASGVLAVVVTGLIFGHKAYLLQSASSRIFERTNWRTVSYLLENTVFLLIGLQVSAVVRHAAHSNLGAGTIIGACAVVTATAVVIRPIWVFPATYLPRLIPAIGRADPAPPWRVPALISWAGMRGVVTLAAAFALPLDTPQRDVLILCALTVVGVTLLLQGSTLPWVVRRLGIEGPNPAQDALQRAEVLQRATSAGLAHLDSHLTDDDPPEVVDQLRLRAAERANAAWERLGNDLETPSQAYARLRLEMIDAERREVLRLRAAGEVPYEVLRQVIGAIDVEESVLYLTGRLDTRPLDRSRPLAVVAACPHLDDPGVRPEPEPPDGCLECLRDGLQWVHLRMCLECGHVGCCDSSIGKHATGHFHETDHPVMQSFEPDETWRWCYVDEVTG